MEKNVFFTEPAKLQMFLRGATQHEVSATIHSGKWETAKRGKKNVVRLLISTGLPREVRFIIALKRWNPFSMRNPIKLW
jgi:hypothetical protein